MNLLETVRSLLDKTPYKTLILYAALYTGVIVFVAGGITYGYYYSIHSLMNQLENVNELRQEARLILQKAHYVRVQRDDVDAMLSQDPDFKIGGYFDELLIRLQVKAKETQSDITQTDRDDQYREVELRARFVDMNMKQTTELLQAIEQNKRVYSKRLDIAYSKKSNLLDVEIVIATLLPKS